MSPAVFRWLSLAFVALLSCSASGQLAGTAGVDYASHGWVIVQVPGEQEATLVHIPPRLPTGVAMPSLDGRLKAAASLNEPPMHLAADGASVSMVFPPDEEGSFEVAQLGVLPTNLQDNWIREPRDRLMFRPTITGHDEVLGLASDNGVLVALVADESGRSLLQLANTGWEQQSLELPWSESHSVQMFNSPRGIHIVEHLRDSIVLHTRIDGSEWTTTGLAGTDVLSLSAITGMQILGVYNGEVVGVVEGEPRSEVWAFGANAALKLGTIDPPGLPMAAAILQSTGRLVLIWSNADERTDKVDTALPSPSVSNPIRRVIEFSLIEGRPIYTGQAVTRAPVSAGEFRHLALLMMMLMGLVLLMVLRPSPEGDVIVLPPGLAIAGAGRRFMATMFDGIIGLVVVSRVLDMPVLEVLGPLAAPATGRLDIWPLLIALMVNVMHASVGEAVFGRSIGKMLNGLIVARVDKSAAGLPAGQFQAARADAGLGTEHHQVVRAAGLDAGALGSQRQASRGSSGALRGALPSGAALIRPLNPGARHRSAISARRRVKPAPVSSR